MQTDYQNYDENELAEALDNYTSAGHPEYDAEFDKTIRALRPDWFADEKKKDDKDDSLVNEPSYYWIAINRSSCAICPVPVSGVPFVSPRPQGLVGFPTFALAKAAQELCVTAPMPVVGRAVKRWRAGKDGVRFVEYRNPERPQTETNWLLSQMQRQRQIRQERTQ